MEGLFVVELVGVAGLFIGLGFFISIVLKMRGTLTEMEGTLRTLGNEIEELTPRLSSALQELEKTGEDIGILANATTVLINRINGKEGSSPMVDGVARMLPVMVSIARHMIPVFTSRKNRT
ncbi:MAG: hypothetical protein JXA64_06335 [Candidatus Fermentibacteraceae bacterium]|nr:hypothetical protein [Candidatus Fermentibacteraceae bacterium]MBN2608714.1 hypothetical protein [Candidatus Fermentibacteraceae bacterium]